MTSWVYIDVRSIFAQAKIDMMRGHVNFRLGENWHDARPCQFSPGNLATNNTHFKAPGWIHSHVNFNPGLNRKLPVSLCSKILDAKEDFCSNILDAKQHFCSTWCKTFVQTFWVQSKTFVQTFWMQSKTFVQKIRCEGRLLFSLYMGAKEDFCSNVCGAK